MALTVFSINEVKSRRMRWVVIFSIQFLLDFSFARRDSWVAESGMITSSGLTTCEKGNIGVPWLKHCNWACWRASVYNMFPTKQCIHPFCAVDDRPPWDLCFLTALLLQWGFRYVDACCNCCGRIRGCRLIYTVCSGLNAMSGVAVQHAALNRSIPLLLSANRVVSGKMLIMICWWWLPVLAAPMWVIS